MYPTRSAHAAFAYRHVQYSGIGDRNSADVVIASYDGFFEKVYHFL